MKIRVWEARRKRGYTLARLSEETKISKSTLNNIENERVSPKFRQLELIAGALSCKMNDLVDSKYL